MEIKFTDKFDMMTLSHEVFQSEKKEEDLYWNWKFRNEPEWHSFYYTNTTHMLAMTDQYNSSYTEFLPQLIKGQIKKQIATNKETYILGI